MRLCFLLLLTGCVINHNPKIKAPQAKAPPKIITLVCAETCTDAERHRLPELERRINETLDSDCFARFILAKGRKWVELAGKSTIEILIAMRKPQVILVDYFYHPVYQLEGYEVADQPVIHINRASLAAYGASMCQEASTMAHEISHAKGFNHRGNDNDEYNFYSPPYQIGHAFDSVDDDYRNGGCCI